MSSRIEQIIEEIEEYIDSCKFQALSTSKIIVNKEQIDELLRELRMKTPDEIKRYQKIIANKDAILADAQTATDQAQEILDNATNDANDIRIGAMQYASDILANAEGIIAHSLDTYTTKYESLINSLRECYEVVRTNRAELEVPEKSDRGIESEFGSEE